MQAMISHEYCMAIRVLGVKGVRQVVEGGYGTVKIGDGLELQAFSYLDSIKTISRKFICTIALGLMTYASRQELLPNCSGAN